MTVQQIRLWLLDQLEHSGAAYNVPVFLRLKGELDPQSLQSSLNHLVKRHQILSTGLAVESGEVRQLTPAAGLSLGFTDLSSLPAEARADRICQLARAEAQKPFHLEQGPLLSAHLFRLGAREHVLALVTHRIVCDPQSLRIFISELAAAYNPNGPRNGGRPANPTRYDDYEKAQKQYLASPRFAADLAFLKKQLEGAASGIELPADYPRPAIPTFSGNTKTFALPEELRDKLEALASARETTLSAVVLTAFTALLCRYSGLDDIVLGTEVDGRTAAHSRTIGYFSNDLVLRVNATGDPTFVELLNRVKAISQAAALHSELPFASLVDSLKLQRDLSRNPLFQVKFASEVVTAPTGFQGIDASLLPLDVEVETLDLTVRLVQSDARVELIFSYSTDLFDGSTIDRMMGHFAMLLDGITADPNQRVSDLPILSSNERSELLFGWNRSGDEYPQVCAHQLFEQQVRRRTSSTVAIFGEHSWTYAELNQRANQLARHLREHGAGPDKLIGIYMERGLDMLAALLGVLKAGAAYVPLDPAYPSDRIAFIVADAGIELLITQQALLDQLPPHAAQVVCMDRDWPEITRQRPEDLDLALEPEHLAYVLYTSGSTGKPKGVPIAHRALVNFLISMQKEPGLSADDVLLAVTTLSFDIAGLELYLPLITGAKVVVASREEAADGSLLLGLMRQWDVSAMQATPATWRLLMEAGWTGNKRLRVLCGGEAMPRELAQQLLPRCAELWNMYGPTETTIWSSIYRVNDVTWTLAPIGRPIANTQFYVLDKKGQPLPVGVAGELLIGGDGLARGYWNRPELTAEKFVTDRFRSVPGARTYKTGDLVRYLPDGNVQYLGRMDNQVKVRGFRIELGEIESVLTQHPLVKQSAVTVREDSPGDKRLIAYLVPEQGQSADVAELRSFAKEQLPEYMVPSLFVTLAAFPLTPNGKVDRKALPAPQSGPQDKTEAVAPRDELEFKLVAIFEKILAVRPVGIGDDFFLLGGHSLMAARMVREIREATGKQVSLSVLFHGATVEYLAEVLRRGSETTPELTATQIQAGSSARHPLFAVVSPGESALGYALLARHLGSEETVYKLQSSGPVADNRPYSEMELRQLAAEYVGAMRAVQPEGPYFLGAMCDGAHIAIRMAQRIDEMGEKVGMLAIFDTWVIENSQRHLLWLFHYYSQRLGAFAQIGIKEQARTAWRNIRKIVGLLLGRKRKEGWVQAYWPGTDFVPPQFKGRITLFKRPKQPYFYVNDPEMGWGPRALNGVDVHVLPIHHEEMLREPYVSILAESLAPLLRSARAFLANGSENQSVHSFAELRVENTSESRVQ